MALAWVGGAAAAPVPAAEVEAALGALRTGPASFERTVVVDLRSVGSAYADLRLNHRYSELHRREGPRRATIAFLGAHRPREGFTITRHDGDVFLTVGDGPSRTAEGRLRRLLTSLLPVPLVADAFARIEEVTPAPPGGRRVRLRLRPVDPSRVLGTIGREFLPPDLRPAIRSATESADLVLDAEGRLVRMTQRLRVTLDGARAAGPGLPAIGPQGVLRLRVSAILKVLPSPPGLAVARPESAGTVDDEETITLFPEPTLVPPRGPRDPGAPPSGSAAAIALARRANSALRAVSGFEASVQAALPFAEGGVRVQVALADGIARAKRTSVTDGDLIALPGVQCSFDEFGGCWDRQRIAGTDPFSPFVLGRAPIPLRGSRFFAPTGRGRLVRIVAERPGDTLSERVRYTLDRRTGRLLAFETLLTRGRVSPRPGLTVERPTPVC